MNIKIRRAYKNETLDKCENNVTIYLLTYSVILSHILDNKTPKTDMA